MRCVIALHQATIAATYILCLQCFINFIKIHFHDSPGRALIEHEKFALTNGSGDIIRKSVWARKIQPGSKINMSVVIRRSDLGAEDRCPKCRSQILPYSNTWWI